MSENYSAQKDIKEAEAMVKALASYVQQDTLYGTTGGFFSGNTPSLTVGALLMRLRRLAVLRDTLPESLRSRLDSVEEQHKTVYNEWKMHYETKMVREAKSRLDSMKQYFAECAGSTRLCHNTYRPEALKRTIVQEILIAMDELNVEVDDDLKQKQNYADGQLRRYTSPAEFFWSSELEAAYPQGAFWWLYVYPPQADN